MFGFFAIDEILRYRGTRFPGSRTLCHPAPIKMVFGDNIEIDKAYGVDDPDDNETSY